MKRFVDEGRLPRGCVRRTGRTGDAGLRWYAQAEAAATEGERAMWHRAGRPMSYGSAVNTRPGTGTDQPREAQA